MKKIVTIADINLENGSAAYAAGRTVMSETRLPADTKVEYVGHRSRWTGTGYRNSLYRIVGTDDLLVIRHNDGPVDNLDWDNVEVIHGYFRKQREYGREVGVLSKMYDIPFEVCLALGTNQEVYPRFTEAIKVARDKVGRTRLLADLKAGINRRKDGLLAVLGSELYDAIGIESMGQKNSERLALYVAKMLE
jgi:hypothetical protein